ncbi:hypothetical protein ACFOJ6_01475 [Gordonia humi]|uniref:hypothetical protein n=1 Tax=Gordonia humi TaxID=686429 RepID=UPI00360B4EF6
MTGSATLQDNDFETWIRNRYAEAQLVIETDPTAAHFREVHRRLGALMGQMPAGAHFALITGYPALIATALVGHAALRDQGDGLLGRLRGGDRSRPRPVVRSRAHRLRRRPVPRGRTARHRDAP